MDTNSLISKAGIPAKYEPVVRVASFVGDKLGERIAAGWDKLIDRLFTSKTVSYGTDN